MGEFRRKKKGKWGVGDGKRREKREKRKEERGGTFSIFALPPFLSTTWMRRRRLSSPPFLPHNLEKEEGILSFLLPSSPLFGFHPCPSLPLLPRSLRTQEEDCQEGVSSVCPLSSFIFCFAFPCPSLPFSIFLGIAPKGGGGGGRIGKRGNKRFAKTKGRLKLAKKY